MAGLDRFSIILICAAILSAISAGFAWRKRDEPGGVPLVVFQLSLVVGLGAYAVDIESSTYAIQVVFASIELVTQAVVAATWVYVGIEYSGLDRWANRKTTAILAVEPVTLTLFLLSPFRSSLFELDTGVSGSLFTAEQGLNAQLLAPHFLFIFSTTVIGSLLLFQLFVRSRHLYRTQAGAVAVAAVAPWAVLLFNALSELEGDLSTFAWALSGIALTVGLYRFKTLDPVPTAKDAVVEKMGAGVIVLDEDELVGDCNPAASEFLSIDPEEIVGKPIAEVFPSWADIDHGETGLTDWQELELSVDGETRFLEVQVSLFSDRFDQVIGKLLVMRDVTARTRRERELARFETIFESVSDRVYVLDTDCRFLMVNEPFASLVGQSPETLEGQPFETILTQADENQVPSQTAEGIEVTVETPDGDQIPCETTGAPISFAGGEAGTVGILRDVSRRKELEASLQETTQQLETIVEASPLAVIGTDLDGRIEVWNPAAEEMFGWSERELRGERPPFVTEEREEEFEDLLERVGDGDRITGYELDLDRKDGSYIEASLSLAPITDGDDDVYGIVGIVSDITEQKQRQRELERQNERLDQFASAISHDLRNPLSSAMGYFDLAREQGNDEYFEKVENAHDRMETMIGELLTIARAGTSIDDPETVQISDIAVESWETSETDGATFQNDLPDEFTVEGDPGLLRNIFENVYRNASDHNDDPVTVQVGTLENDTDGFFIEDDGVGIPEDDQDSVFDHGFTTDDDGTGFGLSIVADVAEAHDWDTAVITGTDGGARFEFVTGR